MITNIIDKRTDPYNILCDAVYEPCWHDNGASETGTLFPSDPDHFTYDELPQTAITAAIRHGNEKWPDVPVTLYLYDWEELEKSYTKSELEIADRDELYPTVDETSGC